jgi:hypothetical protein
MTQPDTLHTRLRAELERRLAVAKAATPGPWEWVQMSKFFALRSTIEVEIGGEDVRPFVLPVIKNPDPGDRVFIALHDPADAIRRYQRDLKTLERHTPVEVHTNIDPRMVACAYEWRDGDGYVEPYEFCPHVKDLVDDYLQGAHRLGVSVET